MTPRAASALSPSALPPWAAVMQPVVVHLPLLDAATRQISVVPVTHLTWLEAGEARWRLMGLPWLGADGVDANAASACGLRVTLGSATAPLWRIVVDARDMRVPEGLTADRVIAAVLDAARRNLGAASPVSVEVKGA